MSDLSVFQNGLRALLRDPNVGALPIVAYIKGFLNADAYLDELSTDDYVEFIKEVNLTLQLFKEEAGLEVSH